MKKSIPFGFVEEFRRNYPFTKLHSTVMINENEYLVCSNRCMIHNTRFKNPKEYPYVFTVCEYFPALDMIIGISGGVPRIIVLVNRAGFPQIADVRIESGLVQQVYYNRSKNVLITAGSGIEIYDFQIIKAHYSADPTVKLVQIKSIAAASLGSKLVRIFADEYRNRFIAPTPNGYTLFTMEGEVLSSSPNLVPLPIGTSALSYKPPKPDTTIQYQKSSLEPFNRLVTTDREGLVRLWHPAGNVINQYTFPQTEFVYSYFISSDDILLVSKANIVVLLNIKTGKYFNLLTLGSPLINMKIYFNYDKITVWFVLESTFITGDISIPWKLWMKTTTTPASIIRYPSNYHSARIAILRSDSIFSLYSPFNAYPLCSFGIKDVVHVRNYIYDRGIGDTRTQQVTLRDNGNERVILAMDNGSIYGYENEGTNFKFINETPMKANFILAARGFSELNPLICCFTNDGNLVFLKFDTLDVLSTLQLSTYPPIFAYFHYSTNTLFIFYSDKMLRISMITFSTIENKRLPNKLIAASADEDQIVLSYENGTVILNNIEEKSLSEVDKLISQTEHFPIVLVKYKTVVIVSDSNEIYFGHNLSDLMIIKSPLSVKSVCFLNQNLDLLIGLTNEVMIVKRNESYPDLEIIDNCEWDNCDISKESLMLDFANKKKQKSTVKEITTQQQPQESSNEKKSNASLTPQMIRARKRYQQMKLKAQNKTNCVIIEENIEKKRRLSDTEIYTGDNNVCSTENDDFVPIKNEKRKARMTDADVTVLQMLEKQIYSNDINPSSIAEMIPEDSYIASNNSLLSGEPPSVSNTPPPSEASNYSCGEDSEKEEEISSSPIQPARRKKRNTKKKSNLSDISEEAEASKDNANKSIASTNNIIIYSQLSGDISSSVLPTSNSIDQITKDSPIITESSSENIDSSSPINENTSGTDSASNDEEVKMDEPIPIEDSDPTENLKQESDSPIIYSSSGYSSPEHRDSPLRYSAMEEEEITSGSDSQKNYERTKLTEVKREDQTVQSKPKKSKRKKRKSNKSGQGKDKEINPSTEKEKENEKDNQSKDKMKQIFANSKKARLNPSPSIDTAKKFMPVPPLAQPINDKAPRNSMINKGLLPDANSPSSRSYGVIDQVIKDDLLHNTEESTNDTTDTTNEIEEEDNRETNSDREKLIIDKLKEEENDGNGGVFQKNFKSNLFAFNNRKSKASNQALNLKNGAIPENESTPVLIKPLIQIGNQPKIISPRRPAKKMNYESVSSHPLGNVELAMKIVHVRK